MRERQQQAALKQDLYEGISQSFPLLPIPATINSWSDFAGEARWTDDCLRVRLDSSSDRFFWTSAHPQTLIISGEINEREAHPHLTNLLRLNGASSPSVISRLSGSFALLALHPENRSLLLASDHFGVRPLYYWSDNQRIVFATRLDTLVQLVGGPLSLNWTSLYHYLNFSYVPGPDTVYRGVSLLSPGSIALCRRNGVEVSSYWDLQYAADANASLKDLAAAMRDHIEHAVRDALPEDLPPSAVGTFLSGGTDSGTIAGLVARRRDPLHAYSIAFHEGDYNELHYAKLLAERFHLVHRVHHLTADELLESIPILTQACEQPFGDTSLVAAWRCARLAAEDGVGLLLAGDGGDELFGGNERYGKDWVYANYHRLPAWLRRLFLDNVKRLPDNSLLRNRLYNFVYRGNLSNPERFYMYDAFASKWGESLISPQLRQLAHPEASLEVVRDHYERVQAKDELDRLLYVDLKMAIWGNDVPKVTTAAQLAGLRVRFPFLNVALAAFTGALPSRLKVRGWQKRYLFKRAVADLLPQQVLQKKKQGFGVPVAEWLRTDNRVREAVLDPVLDSKSFVRECLSITDLRRIVEKHLHGRWNYGGFLWTTMMLERWMRAQRATRYLLLFLGFLAGEMMMSHLMMEEA